MMAHKNMQQQNGGAALQAAASMEGAIEKMNRC
jgi:hypothetical protein